MDVKSMCIKLVDCLYRKKKKKKIDIDLKDLMLFLSNVLPPK